MRLRPGARAGAAAEPGLGMLVRQIVEDGAGLR